MSDPVATLIDDDFLRMLVCPLGKSPLTAHPESGVLVCACGLRFTVTRRIPDLVVEHAEWPSGLTAREQLPCQQPETHVSALP